MHFNKKLIKAALPVFFTAGIIASSSVYAEAAVDENALKREISQAEYHLREFEKEVEQQRGGEKQVYRSKKTALDRIQQLKLKYPDDPRVEELFQRTKTALMKSKGDFTKVDPSWLKYKENESALKKIIAETSRNEWDNLLKKYSDSIIDKEFPIPDTGKVMLPDIQDKMVLLKDVRYPDNQFYGGTGEYVWHGAPSSGYYFVALDRRQWLGPYEAVKRYRRSVDTELADITKYTILGRITDITAEIPSADIKKVGTHQTGWVVEPVAVYVQDHVMAVYDPDKESSGVFAGESKVAEIKNSWFTYREIPNDVTPEKLTEIFMMAIKEKNYDLYVACINPQWASTPKSNAQLRYHWDLHQERFHKEYVHATFDKAHPIEVIKGFNGSDEQENFFLDEDQKEILKKTQGELVETVVVDSRAFNENGKQIGSPHPHKLIRKNGGRWYIDDYAARF